MRAFQNLTKEVLDLLEEDFVLNRELNVKTTNSSGTVLSASSCVQETGLDTEIMLKHVTADKEPLGLNLEKFRLGSDGRVNVDTSLNLNDKYTFKFLAEDGRYEPGTSQNSYGQVGVEMDHSSARGSILVDLVNGPLVLAQGAINGSGMTLGGSVLVNTKLDTGYDTSGSSLVDAGLASRYDAKDWMAAVRSTNMFSGLHCVYQHRVNPAVSVGASVHYSFVSNYQNFAFGSAHKLDSSSTMKVRVDSQSKLAVSYKQIMTPFLTGTVCAQVDVMDWGPDNQNVGVRLAFEPK